jgi:hypothetical protein
MSEHSYCIIQKTSVSKVDSIITKNEFSYFSQITPGRIPEVFAKGIISEAGYRLHSFPAISPDYNEVYWAVIPPKVLFIKKEDTSWTVPHIASFSEGNIQAPFFSHDGKRIYFQMNKGSDFGSLDIWYVEKSENGWSNPVNLGAPPNSKGKESQPSLTSKGVVYFIGPLNGVTWEQGIYCSRLENGNYLDPVLLNEPINTDFIEAYPFIAPDESFLLFSSSRPSAFENDLKLFISFRNDDGSWKAPINLSEILGLKSAVRYGCISPDKKYLFYLMDNKIYWVDAKIIERLK